jgi:hypothetical protein
VRLVHLQSDDTLTSVEVVSEADLDRFADSADADDVGDPDDAAGDGPMGNGAPASGD